MEEKDPRAWKVLKSEYLYRRPWLTARRDTVQLPNGVVNDEYYILEFPDWVNVIARTTDGDFIFIRQYRPGLRRTSRTLRGDGIYGRHMARNQCHLVQPEQHEQPRTLLRGGERGKDIDAAS